MEVSATWTEIKTFLANNTGSRLRYIDAGGNYFIIAHDELFIVNTVISKHNPLDSDLIDFETNYKSTATSNVQKKSHTSNMALTDQIIWTPPSGRRLVITDYLLNFSGTVDADVDIFMDVNNLDNQIFTGRIDVSLSSPIIVSMPALESSPRGGIDKSLKITVSAAIKVNANFFGRYE